MIDRTPFTPHRTWIMTLCAALLLSSALLSPSSAQERFTLEDVMSAPFPTGLVGTTSGDLLAWVQNERGVRNIWVARGPDYDGRAITAYDGDDGQDVADLIITPDLSAVVYVRGGAPNRGGEIPNPTSEPEAAERAIWVVGTDGAEPRQLATGASPRLSPDGSTVAFTRSGQIWTVALTAEAEPERLLTIRGRANSLRWSPDGTRVAFASNRGDHAFVGIFDLESRELIYVDPSVERDGAPVWSPNGRRIAFMRIPNQRGGLPFAPRRSAQPWSIRVADAATGQGREVWRASEGAGSAFRNVSADGPIFWGAHDRIVFPWEGDGWTHLYSVPVGGGPVTALTPGDFEVQFVSMSPDRETVVYSSNQGDIDRQHLWSVPVSGGGARALTPGTDIEWSPVVTPSGAVAFLGSGPTTPAHAAVLPSGTGERRLLAEASIPAGFPSSALVVPEQIVFKAADGMSIHGQLFLPSDLRPGERRPAMLFFHGGSRRQMLLGFHHRGYYHNAYAFNQYLANQGYVVLAVNYRSGIGYGMEFREALNYGAQGASEFNDVLGAGLYLQSRSDVDADRVGLWGGSYGGYLTALGLSRASDLFAAGVDLHGVHDWNVVIGNFVDTYDPAARADFARLAFESSPMAYVDGWRSPVLLIHGDDDRNVPFSESVDLAEALRDRNVDFEQLIFPDEVHGFLLHRNWLAAYRAAADFLGRKLVSRERMTSDGGR